MPTQKSMTLRAFSIKINSVSQDTSYLKELLTQQLETSIVGDRRMQLNQVESEEDLLAYSTVSPHYIFGMMLRISNEGISGQIKPEVFKQTNVHLEEISREINTETSIYKSHYYFLLGKDKVIVSIPSDTTIKRFQTYLNWLLESKRGDCMFELLPMLDTSIPTDQLSDIKSMQIGSSIQINPNNSPQESIQTQTVSITKITRNILEFILGDTDKVQELIDNQLIKADLRIYFPKKPKDLSREDYERIIGATISPISDLDGVKFETKKGSFIMGEEISCKKKVSIDRTSSGHIVEEDLKQEMEKFISELSS